jgi:hypothetical protein
MIQLFIDWTTGYHPSNEAELRARLDAIPSLYFKHNSDGNGSTDIVALQSAWLASIHRVIPAALMTTMLSSSPEAKVIWIMLLEKIHPPTVAAHIRRRLFPTFGTKPTAVPFSKLQEALHNSHDAIVDMVESHSSAQGRGSNTALQPTRTSSPSLASDHTRTFDEAFPSSSSSFSDVADAAEPRRRLPALKCMPCDSLNQPSNHLYKDCPVFVIEGQHRNDLLATPAPSAATVTQITKNLPRRTSPSASAAETTQPNHAQNPPSRPSSS